MHMGEAERLAPVFSRMYCYRHLLLLLAAILPLGAAWAAAPTISWEAVSAASASSIAAQGTVEPHGLDTTVYFEYETFVSGTAGPTKRTAETVMPGAGGIDIVPRTITGLMAHTPYRVRIVGVNADGTSTSEYFPATTPNTPPTAAPDAYHAPLLSTAPFFFDVLANDSDADGDTVRLTSVTKPSSANVELVGGKIRFTPSTGYTGVASFSYTIADDFGGTTTAKIDIVNKAPTWKQDAFPAFPGTSVSLPVLANDSDADGDALSIGSASVNQSSGVTVTIAGANVVVNIPPDSLSSFIVTYRATDGRGGTSTNATAWTFLAQDQGPIRVGSYGATVRAISPKDLNFGNGYTATLVVEYGLDAQYGSVTAARSFSGVFDKQQDFALADLLPATTYHYRFVLTTPFGTATSAGRTFTTLPPALPVLAVSNATKKSVSLFDPEGGERTLATGLGGAPIAYGSDGNLYVSSPENQAVLRITPAGTVSTYATGLEGAGALGFGPDGVLYVTTRNAAGVFALRKVALNGTITTLLDGAPNTSELTVDDAGNVFLSAPIGPIRRVSPAGAITFESREKDYTPGVAITANGELAALLTLWGVGFFYSPPDFTKVARSFGALDQRGMAAHPLDGVYMGSRIGKIYFANGTSPTYEFARTEGAPEHLAARGVYRLKVEPFAANGTRAGKVSARLRTAGKKVVVRFSWGIADPAEHPGEWMTFDPALGPLTPSVELTGLKPHTTYKLRVEADDRDGSEASGYYSVQDASFDTGNTAPAAGNDRYHLKLSQAPFSLEVLANDSDLEQDPLQVTAVTQGAHGTVAINGTKVSYTPGEGYHGNDTFTYTVSDGDDEAIGTVSLYNELPVAAPDELLANMFGDSILNALANDTQGDRDPLTVSIERQPSYGIVTVLHDNKLKFSSSGFKTEDSFQYRIEDGYGGVAIATVNVLLSSPSGVTLPGRNGEGVELGSLGAIATVGIPVIGENHLAAFQATGRGSAGASAIYVGDPLTSLKMVADTKTAAPGIKSALFKSFQDPVLDAQGNVYFMATAVGPGATQTAGLWTNAGGKLALVLSAGTDAGISTPAVFAALNSFAVTPQGRLILMATLKGAKITAANNQGLWATDETGALRPIIREGSPLDVNGYRRPVRAIAPFGALAGTMDQRRGFGDAGDLIARVTLDQGETLLVRERAGRGLERIAATTNTTPDGKLASLGLGVLAGPRALFRGVLTGPAGPGIFAHEYVRQGDVTTPQLTRLAGKGDEALPSANGQPAVPFVNVGDPVGNAEGDLAFIGTIQRVAPSVTAANDTGIWVRPFGSVGAADLLVREGAPVAEITGAKFSAFTSLAMPGPRGVLLTATATFANAGTPPVTGLWAQSRGGALKMLVRTGAPVGWAQDGPLKKVRAFTVLASTPSAPSQGRTASAAGGLAARVVYEDGAQAVVVWWLP